MNFVLHGVGLSFVEEDYKTSLPRKVKLKEPAPLFETAVRGGAQMKNEDRQALEHDIEIGRSVFG